MTTSRLAILLAVMLAGLSGIFMLPKQLGFQPVGLNIELPEYLGAWWGRDVQVTQLERDTLGHDTEFSRKEYDNGRGDRVMASVVLAGQDMMTSIHRPERCLRAQGWDFRPGGERQVIVPGLGRVPMRRLHNSKFVKTTDGKSMLVENVCYYWFVGNTDITASHLERVWLDSRDRIVGGYVQRWGMIMVSADITKDRQRFGRDEAETDQLIEGFLQQLVPRIHKDTLRYH